MVVKSLRNEFLLLLLKFIFYPTMQNVAIIFVMMHIFFTKLCFKNPKLRFYFKHSSPNFLSFLIHISISFFWRLLQYLTPFIKLLIILICYYIFLFHWLILFFLVIFVVQTFNLSHPSVCLKSLSSSTLIIRANL